MYQATIPKIEKYESTGLPYPEEQDNCLWNPSQIPLDHTVQYLQEILQLSTEIQLAGESKWSFVWCDFARPGPLFF